MRKAWEKTKKENKGKPLSKEAISQKQKAREIFDKLDRDLKPGEKALGADDPLIKLFREVSRGKKGGE